MNPNVAFSILCIINGDNAIQDSNELINNIIAYVILVMIDDLNVPPIDEQSAEQAAAPQHEVKADIGIKGNDIAAPIVLVYCMCLDNDEKKKRKIVVQSNQFCSS